MALSTPESDVELARRRREGVFTPPPHWKPRREEVDLKKDYAFKRAQREGGVFDPVEVTGAPEKEPALTRDLNPFTETGAALRRARLRRKWAQIEEIRRDEPVIYGPVAGQQNPVLAIKAADDADDAPPEPEETTEWSVDDPNGSSSPLRAVREEWPAGA